MAGPGLLSLQPSGPLSVASQGAAQGPSAGAGNVNFSGSLLDPANAPKASVDPQATGAALGSVQMGGPKQDAMAQQGDKGRTATAAAEAAPALSGLSGFLIAASGEVESADVDGSREPLMCVLAFTCGDDWALLHGSPSGVTQLACAAAPTLDLT